MFNLFLVPSKISSNFNTCFFLSLLVHLCKIASGTFFSLLDVGMKQKKTFSFSLLYGYIFLLCLISRLFQGFKTACKTISIMPVEVDRLHRPQRMHGFLQRVIWLPFQRESWSLGGFIPSFYLYITNLCFHPKSFKYFLKYSL